MASEEVGENGKWQNVGRSTTLAAIVPALQRATSVLLIDGMTEILVREVRC